MLLTSELVTNAVVQAGTPVEVSVRHLQGWIQVEVFDAGQQAPVVVDGVLLSDSGRGLHRWRPSRKLGVFTPGEMARPSGFAASRDTFGHIGEAVIVVSAQFRGGVHRSHWSPGPVCAASAGI